MAKISNTTVYPNQSPVQLSDYLIGTDASNLETKTFTVQALADVIDGQVTLQEVLDAGNSATQNILLTGNIVLTGDLTGNGNITRTGNITLTGSQTISSTLGVSGLSTLATVDINGGNIDNTQIGVNQSSRAILASVSTSEALRLVSFNTAAPALWIQTGGLKAKDGAGNARGLS